MRWKPKRAHPITRTFAFFPTYIGSLNRYVWLEKIWVYHVSTSYGTASWYDTDYRYLWNGFIKPFKQMESDNAE